MGGFVVSFWGRDRIICQASTHTALVSSASLAVLHLSTYLPTYRIGDTPKGEASRESKGSSGGGVVRQKERGRGPEGRGERMRAQIGLSEVFLSHPVCFPFLFSLQHPLFSFLFSRDNSVEIVNFWALSRV